MTVNDLPDSDRPHAEAAAETGFWGREGAGCLVLARRSGRLLIGLRSDEVMEPETWGTWGGAIDEGLTPEEGVRRELLQETGREEIDEILPLHLFVSPKGDFRYHNFLVVVEDEFEPVLNWEHSHYAWAVPGELPKPLHPGVAALIEAIDLHEAVADCLRASLTR